MAYQTGTINATTDFNSIFDSFLTSNGWTKTTNSVAIASATFTYATNAVSNGTVAASALANVPLGAKLTWTGSGAAKVYLVKKGSTTSYSVISDSVISIANATSVTWSWDTYSKGTKFFNFVGALHNSTNPLQYILLDMYHASTGNHNAINNCQCVRFDPAQSELPATYQIFSNTTPDIVSCVFSFGSSVQHFHLGDLIKVHTSAYVGGEFVCGSFNNIQPASITKGSSITETTLSLATTTATCGGFFSSAATLGTGGLLHCEIDGTTYVNTSNPAAVGQGGISENTIRKFFRGLNQWNSQATLVTPELKFEALSSFEMYLGYIEHIRFVRIDNYNLGDNIVIGSDTWKVFPMAQKNASIRDGNTGGTGLTGTMGFACRYTP